MDYAIGDIQGCYRELMTLLEKIHFNEKEDRLWLVGDLVNRGPDSLHVLRFLQSLTIKPNISLGNHDLHLLAIYAKQAKFREQDDTFNDVLLAKDCDVLCMWLLKQPLCVYDKSLQVVMSHAGMPPCWSLSQALRLSKEVEAILQSEDHPLFFANMYGNAPNLWDDDLIGFDRLRLITNYFTRMRFCTKQGGLSLMHKTKEASDDLFPWFDLPRKTPIVPDILFGHWAALEGKVNKKGVYALDTGCCWGGYLTALCIQTKIKFSVLAQT